VPDRARLEAALERLIAGSAGDDERSLVRGELLAGNIAHDAAGRDAAAGAIVVTRDQVQFSITVADDVYERVREQLFPPPPGILPPFPDLIFIGREEALQHVKALLGVGGGPRKSPLGVVRGWPGVGKTTLVNVLSRDPEVARVYPDGVLWASLDQSPPLMTIFKSWGEVLGSKVISSIPTPEEAVEQLRQLLGQKRMLLIVDDVWEAGHGALFRMAQREDCGLLITTRLPEVAEVLVQSEQSIYNLPVLSDDDAFKLMRILAPEVVARYPDECLALVQDLECLPLALHVAARLLREESKYDWGVTELLRDIRQGAVIIKAQAPPDRVEGESIPTVVALLNKSTDRLDDQTREYFAYLGVMAPKPATFGAAAMRAIWEVDDPRPTIRELVRRGLLEPAPGGRFQLHALLVAHAKSLCTP
jgi:hypothetical protein